MVVKSDPTRDTERLVLVALAGPAGRTDEENRWLKMGGRVWTCQFARRHVNSQPPDPGSRRLSVPFLMSYMSSPVSLEPSGH